MVTSTPGHGTSPLKRPVEHVLAEWEMKQQLMEQAGEHTIGETATLVKELVLAIRSNEEERNSPVRNPSFYVPFLLLIVSGLIYAGIIWNKIGALESKMSAIDSIAVVATEVSNLQQQVRAENEQMRQSQQRLEDRMEKIILGQRKPGAIE